MKKDLTFCLKETVYTQNTKIPLSDICSIYGANDKKLSQSFLGIKNKSASFTAFEISKKLTELYPDCNITSLGPTICNVILNSKEQKKFIVFLKIFILCVVMFFGGAVAIMTFHKDVNMSEVHSGIYYFFTGIQQTYVPVVSIPYTAGIAVGFVVLFGLLKRKKNIPTVLDLDIHKHENDLRRYLSEKNKSGYE